MSITLCGQPNSQREGHLTPQAQATTDMLKGGPGGGRIGSPSMPCMIVMGEGSQISGHISITSSEPMTATNVEMHKTGDWLFVDPSKAALTTMQSIHAAIRPAVEELLQVSGL